MKYLYITEREHMFHVTLSARVWIEMVITKTNGRRRLRHPQCEGVD